MVVSQTPLRISFFGGGTDIEHYYAEHGGAVVSCTIDKYIYVIVKSRYDDQIVLNYSERERVGRVDDVRHPIIREALRMADISDGIEITSIADIPSEGSGLGSSSAFTVGLLNALYNFKGDPKNARELAEGACTIEIEKLGAPIGKQDQYAAAFGGLKRYTFNRDGSVAVESLAVSRRQLLELGYHSNLFFTGVYRSANEVLADQKKNGSRNADFLSRIKTFATDSADLFAQNDFRRIGAYLDEQWKIKAELSRLIENDSIKQMYESGREAGIYGGKLLGAGGGGYFLFLAPFDSKQKLRAALQSYVELPFTYDSAGSRIILNVQDNAYASRTS